MKVAIIGGGPRGLWAVEELVNLAWQRRLSFDIVVYDAGPVKAYDVDGPEYWRMNVDAGIVPGFEPGADRFPPRAVIGQHLQQRWDSLPMPPGVTLTRINEHVDTATNTDAATHTVTDLRTTLAADFVLDVTGHDATWPGQEPDAVGVYPHGTLDAVPDNATVAMRGLALTFIDAVLDLTEGRGGRFTESGYEPSGREPHILPYSRSGRLLNPKPDFDIDTTALILHAEPLIAAAESTDDIIAALATGARILLGQHSTHDTTTAPDTTISAIDAVLRGTEEPTDPVDELRANLAVATGAAPLNATAAVGVTFRALYPAIVARVSFNEPLPGFHELTRRLERVAFGMPVVNARKILALFDAGVIAAPATARPDAVLLVDATLAPPPQPPVRTGRDGFLPGNETFAVIGRKTEGWVLGNDTLSRSLHQVIPAWARRVVAGISLDRVHGLPPLPARVEHWAQELASDHGAAAHLLDTHSSPVNVLNSAPMTRNAQELVDAGADRGVDVRVFFARKSNKALTFVDAIVAGGHGVDVASYRELSQVLAAGVPGRDIIVSAAIKPDELLTLAIDNDVTISVDTVAELQRIVALARTRGTRTRVAPRLAPDPRFLPPTRFGELASTWADALTTGETSIVSSTATGENPVGALDPVTIAGLHVHLHGYAAADRAHALREALHLVDCLTAAGHALDFIDIGGGVPMSYIDDADAWAHFQSMRATDNLAPYTWKSDPLSTIYPYHQHPTRGTWLRAVLDAPFDAAHTIADALTSRGLRLHLEPGRSLLDGCGMTLARVEFVKTRADGLPLVGLGMNRTQCRTTSDDYTVDPILIRHPESTPGDELEAFLVGAYCIEDELILRRRIRFPQGVAPGDIIAIPNTAGYFMHILESASHQIPLAKNVVWPGGEVDRIDEAV